MRRIKKIFLGLLMHKIYCNLKGFSIFKFNTPAYDDQNDCLSCFGHGHNNDLGYGYGNGYGYGFGFSGEKGCGSGEGYAYAYGPSNCEMKTGRLVLEESNA